MIERRTVAAAVTLGAAGRASVGGARLVGHAALFNNQTIVGGMFRERIAPHAFDEAIRRRDDVRATFNHDPNYVLGRTTAGTLTLAVDARGLRYDVTPPDTTWAKDLVTSIARGDVTQSSFAFQILEESWPGGIKGDQLPLRIIESVRLFDICPCTFPAYEDTSVGARDLPSLPRAATETDAAAHAHHRQRLLRAERAAEHDRRVGWLRRSAQSLSLS